MAEPLCDLFTVVESDGLNVQSLCDENVVGFLLERGLDGRVSEPRLREC